MSVTLLPTQAFVPHQTTSWAQSLEDVDAGKHFSLPEYFIIQNQKISPLVNEADLRAHLVLLGAFHRLRDDVCASAPDADDRWKAFLTKATSRFHSWIQGLAVISGSLSDHDMTVVDHCPPLDVAMIWHSYMLNPHDYREDRYTINKGLEKINSYPLHLLASLIEPQTSLPYEPSEKRRQLFSSLANHEFEYLASLEPDETLVIDCPKCSSSNTVPLLKHDKKGLAQDSFEAVCINEHCGMTFGHEALGIARLYQRIGQCKADPEESYLPCITCHWAVPDKSTLTEWKFSELETHFQVALGKDGAKLLKRVIRNYSSPGPFSISLPDAVIRQMGFVSKIKRLGWLHRGASPQKLLTSVVRYHAFVELLGERSESSAVPTLDIDLSWHSHQLLAASYDRLYEIIGCVPNHDDTVAKDVLSDGLAGTCQRWEARFGVPYLGRLNNSKGASGGHRDNECAIKDGGVGSGLREAKNADCADCGTGCRGVKGDDVLADCMGGCGRCTSRNFSC